ncbi:MAG TPA: hypothetical protein VGO80_18405 [Solirubrobacteraceae bacterium]|nr:hypothetical protein [Solirubrobacteraceae bacterium]
MIGSEVDALSASALFGAGLAILAILVADAGGRIVWTPLVAAVAIAGIAALGGAMLLLALAATMLVDVGRELELGIFAIVVLVAFGVISAVARTRLMFVEPKLMAVMKDRSLIGPYIEARRIWWLVKVGATLIATYATASLVFGPGAVWDAVVGRIAGALGW